MKLAKRHNKETTKGHRLHKKLKETHQQQMEDRRLLCLASIRLLPLHRLHKGNNKMAMQCVRMLFLWLHFRLCLLPFESLIFTVCNRHFWANSVDLNRKLRPAQTQSIDRHGRHDSCNHPYIVNRSEPPWCNRSDSGCNWKLLPCFFS